MDSLSSERQKLKNIFELQWYEYIMPQLSLGNKKFKRFKGAAKGVKDQYAKRGKPISEESARAIAAVISRKQGIDPSKYRKTKKKSRMSGC